MLQHHNDHHDHTLLLRLYDEPLIKKSQPEPLLHEKTNTYKNLSSLFIAASLIFTG